MYGRIRAILHHCGCPDYLKYKIWAECANLSKDLWNIQVQKNEVMCPHEFVFGLLPSYAKHLHVFGQMGVGLDGTASTLQDKLKSKGVKKMFVGYSRYDFAWCISNAQHRYGQSVSYERCKMVR